MSLQSHPYIRLVLFCIVVLAAPCLLGPGLFTPKKFDSDLEQQIRGENPEYVFVGDSMLLTRLDPEHFESLTGKRTSMLAAHGLTSAGWYLMVKNFVVGAEIKPRMVWIFFRDHGLSWPNYRTTGSYLEKMEPLMRTEEPALDLVWDRNTHNSSTSIPELLQQIYPLQRHHTKAEDFLQEAALRFSPRYWPKRERLLDAVNDIFKLDNLRMDMPSELARSDSPELPQFDPAPDASFVPHLIEVAREGGIQLCFYRVKRRPESGEEYYQDPEELQTYQESLRAYVEGQGMLYYDANMDPREHLGMFADGDHIDEKFRTEWTEIFHDQMREVLE